MQEKIVKMRTANSEQRTAVVVVKFKKDLSEKFSDSSIN